MVAILGCMYRCEKAPAVNQGAAGLVVMIGLERDVLFGDAEGYIESTDLYEDQSSYLTG
jgi:hypothetical protein